MKLDLSPDEQQEYDAYLSAYVRDNTELTRTDLIQLQDAALYHLLQYRLIREGKTSTAIHNVRTNPKTQEMNILEDLGMTRKQRMQDRSNNAPLIELDGEQYTEREMREMLLEISKQP